MENEVFMEFEPIKISGKIIRFGIDDNMYDVLDIPFEYKFPEVPLGISKKEEEIETPVQNNSSIKNKENYAMQFFIKKGLSKQAASGIVGNLVAESNLNTTIQGDKGTSIGIAQWHDTKAGVGRKTNLFNFAKKRGLNWKNLDTQLQFLWNELKSDPKYGLSKLQKAKTAKEASFLFGYYFERFKGYEDSSHSEHKKRASISQRLFNLNYI